MKKQYWRQFFAAPDDLGGNPGTQDVDPEKQTDDPEKETNDPEKDKDPKFTQSDLDRAIAKALQTRESKLRAEWEAKTKAEREAAERKRLEEEKNYQTLYEKAEAERKALELRSQTARVLAEKGLASLEPVFSADLSTLEGRTAAADSVKQLIDEEVEKRVNERLKTPAPPKSKPAPGGTLSAEEIGKLSMAEYEKARREGRIK